MSGEALASRRSASIARPVKMIVSACLVSWLVYRIDWTEYSGLTRSAQPSFLAGALLVAVLAIVLSAYKWRLLADSMGLTAPFGMLVSSYFVGLFFNNVLPTSIGGDIVRVADLAKRTGNGPVAAASVISERVIAASSLGVITLAALALDYRAVGRFSWLVLIFSAGCAAVVALGLAGRRVKRVLERFPSSTSSKLGEASERLAESLTDIGTMGRVSLLSIIFHAMVVVMNIFIFKAMGISVPFASVLVFIPVISALSMLPVSLNGLGIREMSYVYFFGLVGVSAAQAVAASICFFVLVALTSLIGGIIFAFRR